MAEDAAEGCVLESPHIPRKAPVKGPNWLQCARCGWNEKTADPWFQCRMCGQLHKPDEDER